MKVLWVKSGGLVPQDTGGKIRSFQLARELARLHDVTLLTFYAEHANDAHVSLREIFPQVIPVPMRMNQRASLADCVQYGRNLFSGKPHTMTKFCKPEAAQAVRQLLAREKFDVIVCDFLVTADVIPWEDPTPKIVFTHNVEAVIWKRHYQVSRNPVWKAVSWREYRTMDHMERHYLRQADHVLTVSEADKKTFSEYLDPHRMTVIETGVDVKYFQPAPGADPFTMIFTGSMDWLPNEDGIFWFAEQIFPLIQARVPEAKLTVVGRTPSKRLTALAATTKNLRITGRVEDVRPYAAEAGVYIVPLRIGGGTRIKIFEAMAMGKAVVSTTIGAEGLQVAHGENIVLADTPREFADSVVRLMTDAEERARLERNARSLVEKNYSWGSVIGAFDRVLRQVTQASPRNLTAAR